MNKRKKVLIASACFVLVIILLITFLFISPKPFIPYKIEKTDKINYTDSLEKIEKIQSQEDSKINDLCKTKFFDQGKKTTKVIVLFHGFTNCPEQFDQLGRKFFTQGYNVLIPRLPLHGYSNRLTDEVSKLSPQDLISSVAENVQIATGLGEEVIIGGISGGGVMAAWAGYNYPSVNKVVLIAPLFLPYDLDENFLGPIVRAKDLVPFDIYKWWDDKTKADIEGPKYAYPRFSFKASFQFLELSFILKNNLDLNSELPNKNLKIVYITSENDKAVSNAFAEKVIDKWSEKLGREAEIYAFPGFYNFNHDIIDPNQTTAKPEIVYPKIFELTNK